MSQKIHWQNLDAEINRVLSHPLEKLPVISEKDFFEPIVPLTGMYFVKNTPGILYLPSEEDYCLLSSISEGESDIQAMAIAMKITKNDVNDDSADVFITHSSYPKDTSGNPSSEPPKFDWTPIGGKIKIINDLTTGGVTSALSAEQGKVLKDMIANSGTFTPEDKAKLDGIEVGATKTEIIDTLTSTDTAKTLSANQGRVLKNSIDLIPKDFVGLAHPYSQMYFDWKNGNDTNNGTNTATPKRDVIKFLQTLNHKKLDNDLVISLANYNTTISGSITLTGMSGGDIKILGDTANPINLVDGRINITNCSNKIELQYLGAGMGFNIENCHNILTYGIFAKNTTFGMINKGSNVYNIVPVFDNCKYGMWTTEIGRTFLFKPKGSSVAPNSNIGFSGVNGGYIRVFQNEMTGYGVMTKIENGARVELV